MDSITDIMQWVTPWPDGWYIMLDDVFFQGPFRPAYAKGFIDGLRHHRPDLNFSLAQVKNGALRMAKKNTGGENGGT